MKPTTKTKKTEPIEDSNEAVGTENDALARWTTAGTIQHGFVDLQCSRPGSAVAGVRAETWRTGEARKPSFCQCRKTVWSSGHSRPSARTWVSDEHR